MRALLIRRLGWHSSVNWKKGNNDFRTLSCPDGQKANFRHLVHPTGLIQPRNFSCPPYSSFAFETDSHVVHINTVLCCIIHVYTLELILLINSVSIWMFADTSNAKQT